MRRQLEAYMVSIENRDDMIANGIEEGKRSAFEVLAALVEA